MSEMFDALRRAEKERGKRTTKREKHPGSPAVAPGRVDLPALDMPEGLLREIGILRNSLESLLQDRDKRSLLFTSAVRSEGATTIALNYARLAATQPGEKVLLCEMNARNPRLGRMFSMDGGEGVGEVLTGKSTLQAVIRYIEPMGLHVAQVGGGESSTLQLHLASSFPRLVAEALSVFTTVIFDAPPVTMSPETPVMGRHVDGVVLVVQAGRTKREVVQRSMNAITQMEGRILGVVLNKKKYYIPEFLYKRL